MAAVLEDWLRSLVKPPPPPRGPFSAELLAEFRRRGLLLPPALRPLAAAQRQFQIPSRTAGTPTPGGAMTGQADTNYGPNAMPGGGPDADAMYGQADPNYSSGAMGGPVDTSSSGNAMPGGGPDNAMWGPADTTPSTVDAMRGPVDTTPGVNAMPRDFLAQILAWRGAFPPPTTFRPPRNLGY